MYITSTSCPKAVRLFLLYFFVRMGIIFKKMIEKYENDIKTTK